MYFSAKRRNCFCPHLVVFLDEGAVALSSKRAAVVASEQSASKSPNLNSGTGPSEIQKQLHSGLEKSEPQSMSNYLNPKIVKAF